MAALPHRWGFLDRDGTINVGAPKGEYLRRPEDVALLPGAGAAVRRLNDAGVPVFVVTNQRGVALGHMTLEEVEAVNVRLSELLAGEGARVDSYYVCPHAEGVCDCRKPQPGLLLQAAREHPEIDLSRSAMIGNAMSDVAAGLAVGTTTILLHPSLSSKPGTVTHVAPDLCAAVRWLLEGEPSRSTDGHFFMPPARRS